MKFSKFQQKIISSIINYKPNGFNTKFKELFEYILNKFFKDTKIIITKEGVHLLLNESNTEKLLLEKSNVIEILKFFQIIEKEFFYNHLKVAEEFRFNIKEENLKDMLLIEIDTSIILNNIYSDFYIPIFLIELKENKFKTIEQKNLSYTRRALYMSILISTVSILIQLYCSSKPTQIEILNSEKIKTSMGTNIN